MDEASDIGIDLTSSAVHSEVMQSVDCDPPAARTIVNASALSMPKTSKWGKVKAATTTWKAERASENVCCDICCCNCCTLVNSGDFEKGAVWESEGWLAEEHVEEKGAYTTCVVFNFPDDHEDGFDEKSKHVGKAMNRLVQAVAPDGQGEVEEKGKGRVTVLQSSESMGINEMLGPASCGLFNCLVAKVPETQCIPMPRPLTLTRVAQAKSKRIHGKKETVEGSDKKVCVLVRASHQALYRMQMRKESLPFLLCQVFPV